MDRIVDSFRRIRWVGEETYGEKIGEKAAQCSEEMRDKMIGTLLGNFLRNVCCYARAKFCFFQF